jgi:RNA polymerase sigma factor (sigma-70 family)
MESPTLEGIVAEHLGFIRRVLSRGGVSARDLDDVAQEVLCTVAARLPSFDPGRACRPDGAMRGWLFRICKTKASNHRRAVSRRAEDLREPEELDGLGSAGPDPESCFLEREGAVLLARTLDALRPERREVIVAHQLQGVPMGEVARRQGVPAGTAWNRLRLARVDMRSGLKEPSRRWAG